MMSELPAYIGHLFATEEGSQTLTGLGFSRLAPDELRPLIEKDPAVVAGMEAFKIVTYLFPTGALQSPREAKAPVGYLSP